MFITLLFILIRVYEYEFNLVQNYIIFIDKLLTGSHADTTMITQKKD